MRNGLIAVNEGMALYKRTERMADREFDPYQFIDGLLSIRTAYGLVRFLSSENTAAFSRNLYSIDSMSFESEAWPDHGEVAPLYCKGSLIGAADRCGIDYLDDLTDIDGLRGLKDAKLDHSKDVLDYMTRWKADDLLIVKEEFPREKEADARCVSLMQLARLKNVLRLLFSYASVALGDGETEGIVWKAIESDVLGFSLPTSNRECLCIRADDSLVFPFFLRLSDEDRKECYYILEETDRFLNDVAAKRVGGKLVRPPSIDLFEDTIYITDYGSFGESAAARMLCGAVSARIITEFSKQTDDRTKFSFSLENGFKSDREKESHEDMILREVVRIVENGRVGLCEVCNLPFVMAYENGKSTSARKTCGDACRARKANHAR